MVTLNPTVTNVGPVFEPSYTSSEFPGYQVKNPKDIFFVSQDLYLYLGWAMIGCRRFGIGAAQTSGLRFPSDPSSLSSLSHYG